MPNGAYSAETKAEAVRLHLEGGLTQAEIARRLGVHPHRVHDWIRRHVYGPAADETTRALYRRTREEMSELVYETVVETLRSLRARAIATADPDWIKGQNASDLAALDSTGWNFLVRFIASFRPIGEDERDADVIDVESQPAADRNGAVDPAG